jgi:hypothetical protein
MKHMTRQLAKRLSWFCGLSWSLVFSWVSGGYVDVLRDDADDVDEGQQDGAQRDGAEVVAEEPPDGREDRVALVALVAAEVPGAGRAGDDEVRGGQQEGHAPEEAEAVDGQVLAA